MQPWPQQQHPLNQCSVLPTLLGGCNPAALQGRVTPVGAVHTRGSSPLAQHSIVPSSDDGVACGCGGRACMYGCEWLQLALLSSLGYAHGWADGCLAWWCTTTSPMRRDCLQLQTYRSVNLWCGRVWQNAALGVPHVCVRAQPPSARPGWHPPYPCNGVMLEGRGCCSNLVTWAAPGSVSIRRGCNAGGCCVGRAPFAGPQPLPNEACAKGGGLAMGTGSPAHGLIKSQLQQAGAEAAGGVCTCVVVGGTLGCMAAEVALLTQRAPLWLADCQVVISTLGRMVSSRGLACTRSCCHPGKECWVGGVRRHQQHHHRLWHCAQQHLAWAGGRRHICCWKDCGAGGAASMWSGSTLLSAGHLPCCSSCCLRTPHMVTSGNQPCWQPCVAVHACRHAWVWCDMR
jgi:hypothetical protein